jgi:GxxExxY protein
LRHQLANDGLKFRHQVRLPIVVLELKAVEKLLPLHLAHMLTYLKLSTLQLGLIINFNVPHLRDGIRRVIRS